MQIVHHMIMFAGSGMMPSRSACYDGRIMYAWARTGQTTPIGLDFADTKVVGDGYEVGGTNGITWVALQIHYQNMGLPTRDTSGIRLWFSPTPPLRPLEVELLLSSKVRIPPRSFIDECVTCRVTRGGLVVAYRNHAHRLARDIWSEHFDRHGRERPPLGRLSSQLAQIIRILPKPRAIEAGDTLLLHCNYDARNKTSPTYLGADERYNVLSESH